MNFLEKLLKQYFEYQEGFSGENLYLLATRVKPGLIRVDADEVSYPLHIILRYELEKQLIAGSLEVADLPSAWDEYMQTFFGLSTRGNDINGVMQDVHWPSGAFGYFPAYTVGALIAAQLFSAALKQFPTIVEQIGNGDFSVLLDWLKKHVHQKASSLPYDVMVKHATGRPLSVDSFIEHLQERYAPL